MNRIRTSLCLIALPLAINGLAGCAALDGYFGSSQGRSANVAPGVPLHERAELEPISRNYFVLDTPDQSVVGEPQIVFTNAEDTFPDLAREYGLGFDELVAANPGIDPWLPGEGTPILLPTQYVLPDVERSGVVLNIASKRLFYFLPAKDGELLQVLTYPIGIGRVGWETPLGSTTVVSKARDPHWYVPASVREEHAAEGRPLPAVVPPGPDNPLGNRVLKLDMPGYLIHGTNQPYGVGMRVSHGCVRLYPENIEHLYELVGVGETVTIVNEPYLAGWRHGELYFESHRPLEDDPIPSDVRLHRVMSAIKTSSRSFDLEMAEAEAKTVAEDGLGVPVRVLRRDIDEVFERARVVRNTVEPDPNMPSLEEVRALLDEPLENESQPQPSAQE
ncbi:MAG: L,D-transpeptidase family protein [Gammaproteobacteria bacterium]|nr:L,D-transpeptidase family protein [Gammaproteobacteria bacterium]MDH4253128.1 L,D-transpeptidase family protein [Gammaproteobacteria bacterium]MDH5308955.1 L,D-transpeptidase family protein [Gammaproteobacteria bacterium]